MSRLFLYWHVGVVAPIAPGTGVIADLIVAEEAQDVVAVCGSDASLAVGDDFVLRWDAGTGELLLELLGRLEGRIGFEGVGPLAVHRAWDVPGPHCLGDGAGVLVLR